MAHGTEVWTSDLYPSARPDIRPGLLMDNKVQQVLPSAQEVPGWPDEMPDNARRQVIPVDCRYLLWALSAVERWSGQAADEVAGRSQKETWHGPCS